MEFETIDVPVEVLGEEVLYEGVTHKIKIDRYYDLDGKKIYDDKEPCETLKGDFSYKIVALKRSMYGVRCDIWTLYINGKEKCTIQGYEVQKTQLKVTNIWGWG